MKQLAFVFLCGFSSIFCMETGSSSTHVVSASDTGFLLDSQEHQEIPPEAQQLMLEIILQDGIQLKFLQEWKDVFNINTASERRKTTVIHTALGYIAVELINYPNNKSSQTTYTTICDLFTSKINFDLKLSSNGYTPLMFFIYMLIGQYTSLSDIKSIDNKPIEIFLSNFIRKNKINFTIKNNDNKTVFDLCCPRNDDTVKLHRAKLEVGKFLLAVYLQNKK